MLRRFRALVLLSVLFWQVMAAFGAIGLTPRANELEHLMMHGQDVRHHHHADLTPHLDGTAVETNHLHADSESGTLALVQSIQMAVASLRSMSNPARIHTLWLSPTLEGPLRPPTQSA
jgi:hypothetical protein